MKNIKFLGLALLTSALIFAVMYGMIAQIDERLQARETESTEAHNEVNKRMVLVDTTEAMATTSETVQPPVSEVAEVTDTDVTEWEMVEDTETAPVTSIDYAETEPVPLTVCTDSDLMLLAKLIQSEAGYDFCTDEHQRAVASVLLNHVASPYFNDSIYGCIFSGWVDGGNKNYGIGSYAEFMSIVPSERAIANAQYVMTYGSTVGDAIYQAEFIQGEIVAVFSYPGTGAMTTYICR